MMLVNTQERYGSLAKFFHWTVAILIVAMLFLGFLMAGHGVVNVHKLTGLLILSLAALRLIWKLLNKQPRLPDTVSLLEKIAARSVQALLYVCMFGMPLSGWIMTTAKGSAPYLGHLTFPMPGIAINYSNAHFFYTIHNTLAFILIGLIGLHVLGVLKHQFIDKDPRVLRKMLPNFISRDC